MKVRGTGCHLMGVEGSSPPLPYIEVSEATGESLIAKKLAEEVTGADAEPAKAAKKAPEPKVPEPKAPEPKVETPPPPPPPPADKVEEGREALIMESLDLVEGEPTVAAVEEITGLANVTADELAAAVAAHAAAHA